MFEIAAIISYKLIHNLCSKLSFGNSCAMRAIVCSTLRLESDKIFEINVDFLTSRRVSMEILPSSCDTWQGCTLISIV